MKNFWICFVPLFVAVDAVGVLPIFWSLTENMERREIFKIIYQSVITASVVAFSFLLIGVAVLKLLGITVADFMIAGGILLLVISISDLVNVEKIQRMVDPDNMGAVPLGVPLITGPAVLTTSILLLNEHGLLVTSGALLINILLAGGAFFLSEIIKNYLGGAGTKTISKIASLLLAAIGVMMMRRGITFFISQ
ncbi:MAG: MarC family protein [bacterium]